MGEYGRMVFEYLVILATPTVSPHLEVLVATLVLLAFVAVAAVVLLVVLGVPAVSAVGASGRAPRPSVRRLRGRVVRGTVRARAPAGGGIHSHF